MSKPVFLSFCYKDDVTRYQCIRNMGKINDNQIINSNDFEKVKQRGTDAVEQWIDEQMKYKQCLIVLIGENTANRPFVQYEIKKAKEKNMPMFGIYIHNIKDINGNYSNKGEDPFKKVLGDSVNYDCYNPSHYDYDGLRAYNTISAHIDEWIDTAILKNKIASYWL